MKTNYFWLTFGSLLSGIIGINGLGGINGKQRVKKMPVFFPLFPLFPCRPYRPENLGRVGHRRTFYNKANKTRLIQVKSGLKQSKWLAFGSLSKKQANKDQLNKDWT